MGNPGKPLLSLGFPAPWLEREDSKRRYGTLAKETSSAKHFESLDTFDSVPQSAVDQGEVTTATS